MCQSRGFFADLTYWAGSVDRDRKVSLEKQRRAAVGRAYSFIYFPGGQAASTYLVSTHDPLRPATRDRLAVGIGHGDHFWAGALHARWLEVAGIGGKLVMKHEGMSRMLED